jgi:hypothetical protein
MKPERHVRQDTATSGLKGVGQENTGGTSGRMPRRRRSHADPAAAAATKHRGPGSGGKR